MTRTSVTICWRRTAIYNCPMGEVADRQRAEELFTQFAAELLSLTREWTREFGVPRSEEERLEFQDNFPFPVRRATREAPYYQSTLVGHMDHPFWSSDLAIECAREHYKLRIYPGSQWLEEALVDRLMHRLVHSYLPEPVIHALQTHGFDASLEQVLATYREFAHAWTSPLVRCDVSVPLIGLTGSVSSEELRGEETITDGLRLQAFSADDKNRLWQFRTEFPFSEPINEEHFARSQFQLVGRYEEHLPRQFPSPALANDVHLFLLALRLHKSGDVGAPYMFRTELGPTTSDTITAHSLLFGQQRPFPGRYLMEPGDLTRIRAIVGRLLALDNSGAAGVLHVALDRFMRSHTRFSREDRVIDLAVALESCLLEHEPELAYKFRLRGAALFVGSEEFLPSRVSLLLHALYTARSKIVHDGRLLSDLQSSPVISEAAEGGDESHLLNLWEHLSRVIVLEVQTRILTALGRRDQTRKVPKPGEVMKSMRDRLDAVLVEGLDCHHKSRVSFMSDEPNENAIDTK